MASSSDYSVIHEKYQEEGLPKGISIVRYCEMQGVPYKGYERWYKRERHAAVYSVEVVGSRKPITLKPWIWNPGPENHCQTWNARNS